MTDWTESTFTKHYGYSPQEFFDRTVVSDAAGKNISTWTKEIADAEAKLQAIPDPQTIPAAIKKEGGGVEIDPKTGLAVEPKVKGFTHQSAIAKIAELETFINARRQDIKTAKFRQEGAKKFLAGDIPDYLPYLMAPSEGHTLATLGLIDTTRVPTA